MVDMARRSDEERMELFRNTASRKGLNEAIVEKDFWVCYMLDYLFHCSVWKNRFVFKGGTSLSKAFHLINRFSEDIDLVIDWRVLGYGTDEPWKDRSKTKQDAFNKEANVRCCEFLSRSFVPEVRTDLNKELGRDVALRIDEGDGQTVVFEYPRLFSSDSALRVIRLEIGALATWCPAVNAYVEPYAAECYPRLFAMRNTQVLTAAPERTFWEKATILHHEANRPEHLDMPSRYSRHYYDLFCMANSSVLQNALSNMRLLQKVVAFKQKFYPRSWAGYQEAVPGTFRLVPPRYRMPSLQADYDSMHEMFYEDVPCLDEIMTCLERIEHEINMIPES